MPHINLYESVELTLTFVEIIHQHLNKSSTDVINFWTNSCDGENNSVVTNVHKCKKNFQVLRWGIMQTFPAMQFIKCFSEKQPRCQETTTVWHECAEDYYSITLRTLFMNSADYREKMVSYVVIYLRFELFAITCKNGYNSNLCCGLCVGGMLFVRL